MGSVWLRMVHREGEQSVYASVVIRNSKKKMS